MSEGSLCPALCRISSETRPAPAVSGKLIAKGAQIKLGKTLGYAEARVTDEEGRLLAHGTSTLMILPNNGLILDRLLPPKFSAASPC